MAVLGCYNVYIKGITCSECTGDPINIASISSKSYIEQLESRPFKNVVVENCILDHGGRNGITVGDGENISINNCIFNSIDRVEPKAGIDIEPNHGIIENVCITNCRFFNCKRGVSSNGKEPVTSINTIKIDNCYFENCSWTECIAGCIYLNNECDVFSNSEDILFKNLSGLAMFLRFYHIYYN